MTLDGSTLSARDQELLEHFHENPVGHVVELLDGSRVEVAGYRDTPRERWLRLKRPGGPWIPFSGVAGLVKRDLVVTHLYVPDLEVRL
jgi:hypothetical protein